MKKDNMNIQILIIALIVILTTIFTYSLASCKKDEPAKAKSDKKEILSFVLSEQKDTTQIDSQNKKVTLTVKYNTNLAKLSPVITVSEKASIHPASGDTVDFSNSPVSYIVT